jgi:hypothetical protein
MTQRSAFCEPRCEIAAAIECDFRTIRECHTFLRRNDQQVDVQALAQKLGVNDTKGVEGAGRRVALTARRP